MSLMSQAIVIRDETAEGANTHLRVGNLLVEMAAAIGAMSGAINSTFCPGNSNTTEVADVSVAVESYFSDAESVKTGSGIAISLSAGDVYGYFSGLDATHVYSVSYTFSFSWELFCFTSRPFGRHSPTIWPCMAALPSPSSSWPAVGMPSIRSIAM